ncbi:MAG: matrixin family metalloprotease [Planctomycetes bacterium]|nr:matrixin family metalloprotease [Planctomycetota bacterium]
MKTASLLGLMIAAAGIATVSFGADPYRNEMMRPNYPEHNYSFQDHRDVWDIFARRLAPELCDAGDPDSPGVFAACYDPKNPPPPDVQAALEAYMRGGYQDRFNVGGRWSRVGQGTAIALTWSFVPDGTVVGDANAPGGAGASDLFSRMDSLFGGNRALWISKIQACFDRWAALSGVSYTRVRNGTNEWDDGAAWGSLSSSARGDVRIGMKNIDGANGILAYNQFPDNGDMVIDRSENWASSGGDYRFLRNVVMHEHGHGLGFAHVCPIGNTSNEYKLMEPFVNTAYDGPQQDDIRAVQYNYGDANEPNDTAATATAAGTITGANVFALGAVPTPLVNNASTLSIDNSGDSDYYAFTLDQPRLISVTLTPVGTTYLESAQNGDGSCPTAAQSVSTNGAAIADLKFEIRNSTGTTLYRLVNDTAAGVAETTTNFLASPAGTFVIRVSAVSAVPAGESQLYKLSLQSFSTVVAPSASNNTFTDKVRVTWPNVIPDANAFQVMRATSNSIQAATQIASLAAGVFSYDDTTATPATPYYYWVKVRQPGNDTVYKYTSTNGVLGVRAGANQPPVANAGPDQSLTDSDGNGTELVSFNGSLSSDPDGSIIQFAWTEGATTLASGPSAIPTATLGVGQHTVTLTVTDNSGATGTDTVLISISAPCPADFDASGGIDGSDVEAFFNAWSAGDISADVDQNGGIDGADVEVFFQAWEAGGC